jgi:Na+/H+ antiporter NhaD/arsenite permease-like protein
MTWRTGLAGAQARSPSVRGDLRLDVYIAGGIFLVAYLLIATERVDRTLVALLGGFLVVVLGILDQEEAFAAIDFNVIFLLAGMMVMAGALRKTGFFEYVAGHAIRLSRGEPYRLLVFLTLLTAGLSAVLDNVTTVVLLTPVILSIARTLRVSPFPYLISEVFASNIGGTATLIGDPPNIMIGSAAGLSFADFLVNLSPVIAIILVAFLLIMRLTFEYHMEDDADRLDRLALVDPAAAIRDRPLMNRILLVLGVTIVAFVVHSAIGLEPATIAMLGATVVMLIGRLDPHDALNEIEWNTLFFFVGLFIMVDAIVRVGIVGGIASMVADATGGNLGVATLAILWFSALVSAIVDNIPYTATAIPIIQQLADGGLRAEPMWWALSLGACLGGNLTIVGASANIVVANMAARDGHPITFLQVLRYGAGVVAASMVISSVYLWVRYLL